MEHPENKKDKPNFIIFPSLSFEGARRKYFHERQQLDLSSTIPSADPCKALNGRSRTKKKNPCCPIPWQFSCLHHHHESACVRVGTAHADGHRLQLRPCSPLGGEQGGTMAIRCSHSSAAWPGGKNHFFQDNAAAVQANHPTRHLKLSYDKTPRSAIAHRSRYYCSKGPELSPSIFAPQPRSGYEPQGPQTSASEVSSCKECKQLRNASGFPTRIHRGKPRHQATAAFQERIRAEK